MKGLLIKDFHLILQRKQTLFLFIALAFVLGFTMHGTFIVGYLPFLFAILAISTISYDELDNGYAFLMTLPIDAKVYVKEKFIFCFFFVTISWIGSVILYAVSNSIKEIPMDFISIFPELFTFLFMGYCVCALMIPIQIKFGLEKSRIVMALFGAFVFLIAFIIKNAIPMDSLRQLTNYIDGLQTHVIVLALLLVTVCMDCSAYLFSIKAMASKEF